MDKKSDILTKVGKDAGFNVPEGYFADFAKKMAASLPKSRFLPSGSLRAGCVSVRMSTWRLCLPVYGAWDICSKI